MKNLKYLLTFFLLLYITFNIKAQTFDWAFSMGDFGDDRIQSMVTDKTGNIYITGEFESFFDFDPGVGVNILNSIGQADIFIAKYNSQKKLIWAKRIGDINGEGGTKISLDNHGFLYVSGLFFGTIDFDPGIKVFNLTYTKGPDEFLLKLDTAGNFASVIGGNNFYKISNYDIDSQGSIVFVSTFTDTVDFNPDSNATYNLETNSQENIAIFKWNSNGIFQWAKKIDGVNSKCIPYKILIDHADNIILYGTVEGTVDIDPSVGVNNVNFTTERGLLLKLDPNANLIWHHIMPPNFIVPRLLRCDPSNNILMSGEFLGRVDFDFSSSANNLTTGLNITEQYILKMKSNGNFEWVHQTGINYNNFFIDDIISDNWNSVYIYSDFKNSIDLDLTASTDLYNAKGSLDYAVSKYDSSGNYLWGRTFGGNGKYYTKNISFGDSLSLIMTGSFQDSINVTGDSSLYQLVAHPYYSNDDCFIVKWKQCFSTYFTRKDTSCGVYQSPYSNKSWSTSGTYFDTIPNFMGCDSSIKMQVYISNIDTTISSFGISIASNSFCDAYQWLNCDSNYAPIVGATSQFFTPASNGNYAVALRLNNCIDTSICYNYISTNIQKYNLENNFNIYPNPSRGNFIINFPVQSKTDGNGQFDINQTLKVFDIKGQLVVDKILTQNNQEINLSQFEKGIYILRIGNQIKKLVLTE